jgi:hypothetical protein
LPMNYIAFWLSPAEFTPNPYEAPGCQETNSP